MTTTFPDELLDRPLERRSRGGSSSIPSSFRQVAGAMLFCLGVALLSLCGYGSGSLPGLDIAAFVLVLCGAGISGVLPGWRQFFSQATVPALFSASLISNLCG